MDPENRVVVLIDMDCFYCQVEEKFNPELKGKPIAVVQYNPWKGGGIIAVNYVARDMGVTRHMRGDEAKEKCPEIELPSVPCQRGKADITKYREAGKEVAKVLQKFTTLLERASIDEAYLDITAAVQKREHSLNVNTVIKDMLPSTFALGYNSVEEFIGDIHNCSSTCIDFDYEHSKQLLIGAVIVSEIRAAVYEETGYRCSAGIAHNKILAKLVCGMNKPNKQTILPKHSINILYKTLPIKKVKHLGGKFGDTVCEILKINKMSELQAFPEKVLQSKFDDKNGTWLYNIARGIDQEPVQARFNPKSIGCCKQFRGKAALLNLESLRKWLKDLGDEIEDRLEKDSLENNRTPKQMVVSFSTQLLDGRDTSSSRSYNFATDEELCGDLFSSKSLELLMESTEGVKVKDDEPDRRLRAPIKFLGISVGKFEDYTENKKTRKILDYFSVGTSVAVETTAKEKTDSSTNKTNKVDEGKEYILQKYFKVADKHQDEKDSDKTTTDKTIAINNEKVLSSPLDKQESFFAKFLHTKDNNIANNVLGKSVSDDKLARATTPVCNIIRSGDDSSDTNYSSSTIDLEINKSIALFEDDPDDIERVSSMRKLLQKSAIDTEEKKIDDELSDNVEVTEDKNDHLKTFVCTECGKTLNIDLIETHLDYHLALRLREEDRQQVRKARIDQKTKTKGKLNKKVVHVDTSGKSEMSITSFLVKINDNAATEVCSECGKKVLLEKFSEHLDFHEAQKLNKELNKKTVCSSVKINVKRKRKSASPIKKSKVPCKSIESFFR